MNKIYLSGFKDAENESNTIWTTVHLSKEAAKDFINTSPTIKGARIAAIIVVDLIELNEESRIEYNYTEKNDDRT